MLSVVGQGITPLQIGESEEVRYFDEHKHSIIPVWLPTASPEFMVSEKCWNISKNDLLVLTYYYHHSFTEFRRRIGLYFRTKRFKLIMRNYLVGGFQRNYEKWYTTPT
jgi:hypothetical protein